MSCSFGSPRPIIILPGGSGAAGRDVQHGWLAVSCPHQPLAGCSTVFSCWIGMDIAGPWCECHTYTQVTTGSSQRLDAQHWQRYLRGADEQMPPARCAVNACPTMQCVETTHPAAHLRLPQPALPTCLAPTKSCCLVGPPLMGTLRRCDGQEGKGKAHPYLMCAADCLIRLPLRQANPVSPREVTPPHVTLSPA